MINNSNLTASIVFTTGAGGAITATVRGYRCTAAAGAGNGRFLVNLTEGIASADLIACAAVSAVGNVGGGAGLFATVTRVTDLQWEVGVFTATAAPSNTVGDVVRVAFIKLDPA